MKRFCRKKSKNASQGDYFISLHILARRGGEKILPLQAPVAAKNAVLHPLFPLVLR
jgi:hypothetical protein